MSALEILDRFFADEETRAISRFDPQAARTEGLSPEVAELYRVELAQDDRALEEFLEVADGL